MKFNIETKADALYAMCGNKGNVMFLGLELKTGQLVMTKKESASPKIYNLFPIILEGRWVKKVRGMAVRYLGLITKGTAMKRYGKKTVEATPVLMAKDNPYYKCSEPMKLYATPMLEYVKGMLNNQK